MSLNFELLSLKCPNRHKEIVDLDCALVQSQEETRNLRFVVQEKDRQIKDLNHTMRELRVEREEKATQIETLNETVKRLKAELKQVYQSHIAFDCMH